MHKFKLMFLIVETYIVGLVTELTVSVDFLAFFAASSALNCSFSRRFK